MAHPVLARRNNRGWLRPFSGALPTVEVFFEELGTYPPAPGRPTVSVLEITPVDSRPRQLEAGAYRLSLPDLRGTERTVCFSEDQHGLTWHGEETDEQGTQPFQTDLQTEEHSTAIAIWA